MTLLTDENQLILTGEFKFLQSDCDCACPQPPFPITHNLNSNSPFIRNINSYHSLLTDNYHLVYSDDAPIGPSVLNASAWQRYQSFSQEKLLSEPIDYQLAEQGLIVPSQVTSTACAHPPQQLTAWLHVTNACNLECPYCYVRKSSEHLSEEIGMIAIKRLFETAQEEQLKTVKLKYAGGEALLHFSLIQKLHSNAIQLAQQMGIELTTVILSNGTVINSDIVHWLAKNHVKLMLSVDGIGEAHDRQRPTKKGKPTFAILERHLLQDLLPNGIKPDISITVTQQNANSVADVVQWAIQHDLPFTINFYRENLLSQSKQALMLEEITIISGIKAAYQAIEANLPTHSVLNSLLDKVQSHAHTHTCGVGKNYVVITHKGQVAQCQMHLDETLGSIQQNKIIPLVAQGKIQNLSVDEKEGCKTCEFRYRCTGGCPVETYRVTGRWDIKSPHCHIYKALYPEALRLEGLRLLKLHGLHS